VAALVLDEREPEFGDRIVRYGPEQPRQRVGSLRDIRLASPLGWFLGLLSTVGLLVSGYLRQSVFGQARNPPGPL